MIEGKLLNGNQFENLILNGVANFKLHIDEINALNVFPIPDGDTGDNMFMTINGGVKEMVKVKSSSLSDKANALSKGMLLSARGNSGVIFSQLFAGFAKGVSNIIEADLNQICLGLDFAVKQAYSAVSQPVEGTILTVAKDTANKANSICERVNNISEFNTIIVDELKKSLNNTPELLPVLKEAGVVDSGGAGLYYFVLGLSENSNLTDFDFTSSLNNKNELDFSKFNKDSVMEYGYCTECLLQLQTIKVDVDNFDISSIINYLESIGESVVAFKTDSIVKMHVHTLTPYKALEFCHQFGEFLSVKIENMTLQHNELDKKQEKFTKKRQHKKFALVTVAQGKGLTDIFYELGADIVIEGGQTKNPSVEDFVSAFNEVNADEIFVLPNNSNIFLAANGAKEIFTNSKIHIIETRNLGQAYSILSMLDYSLDDGELIKQNMLENMAGVLTCSISKTVRDACINDIDIKNGDYLGFSDKTVMVSTPAKLQTLQLLLDKCNLLEKSFLIAVYGESITEEEKLATRKLMATNYADLEFYEIDGGQDVYDFILIIE